MGTIRAAIAGLERSEIQERMYSAKEQMRREGRWPNSDNALPFGVSYDRQTTKWAYKPEAEKVRDVFRRFLSGDTNYDKLSELLGMSRGSVRNILQNPIYTGWMVYDQKRDLSPGGKRCREGGHQGDRRKIARAADEIIRVRVIEEPLVNEAEFNRAQQMIRLKAERNLRMRQKVGLFTYNGFLWCAKCDDRLHTFRNQFDRYYYICSNKKRKNEAGESLCPYTGYMSRDKFEPMLDEVFSERLKDRRFLRKLYDYQMAQAGRRGSESRMSRLRQNTQALEAKRQRVTNLYIEGELSRDDRTLRLAQIDRELRHSRELLAEEAPMPVIDEAALGRSLAPCLTALMFTLTCRQ